VPYDGRGVASMTSLGVQSTIRSVETCAITRT
jgi:hypothetical protein